MPTLLPVLRVYWRLLVAGVRRQSTYRLATLAGLVANVTFGLLKTAILLAAVGSAGGDLAGYDAGSVGAYVWLSQGLLGSVNMWGRTEMTERVRSGDVAVDFLRPVAVQGASITTEVGGALFALLPRGVPSVLLGVLVLGVAVPTTPGPYVLGAVSTLVGITLSHALVYALATTGFWLVETRGVTMLYMSVAGLLAGLYTPIWFFPDWLLVAARATPFPAMLMYPVDVLTGRVTGWDAVAVVSVQLAWLAGVLLLGHVLTRAGRRVLEVQGG